MRLYDQLPPNLTRLVGASVRQGVCAVVLGDIARQMLAGQSVVVVYLVAVAGVPQARAGATVQEALATVGGSARAAVDPASVRDLVLSSEDDALFTRLRQQGSLERELPWWRSAVADGAIQAPSPLARALPRAARPGASQVRVHAGWVESFVAALEDDANPQVVAARALYAAALQHFRTPQRTAIGW